MLNITQDLRHKQGLLPNKQYHGIVVDNDDPTRRRRIRIRVLDLFDEIPDDKLPWAIPMDKQTDGSSEKSGSASVPKLKTKVMVEFQEGNPLFPVYKQEYPTETTNVIQESRRNYPDRVVHRLRNKGMIVVDTATNEIFIRQPGDAHIYIEGNAHVEIKGNVVEKIHGNKDEWIKGNLQQTVVGNRIVSIEGKDVEIVKGSRHTRVESDLTEHTIGSKSVHLEKNLSEAIDGNRNQHIVGKDTLLVEADSDTSVLGRSVELVQGGATLRYKKDVNTVVSGSVSLVVDGNNTESVRGRK